jgi:hypothetical protein
LKKNKGNENSDRLPSRVDEAVDWVIANLREEQKTALAGRSPDEVSESLPFGFGMWIRNSLGLWGGNRKLLKSCGCRHPDDASAFIIKGVLKKLGK